jgi:hypothetical protein
MKNKYFYLPEDDYDNLDNNSEGFYPVGISL